MNRSHLTLATSLLVAAAVGVLAPVRADEKTARRELEAIYLDRARVRDQGNPARLVELTEQRTAPEFTVTYPNGDVQTREQLLRNLRNAPQGFPGYRNARCRTTHKITRLDLMGDTASVLGRWEEVLNGVDLQGRRRREVSRGKVRALWVKTPDGWKEQREELLDYEEYRDGRLIRRDGGARKQRAEQAPPLAPTAGSSNLANTESTAAASPAPDTPLLAERLVSQSAQIEESDLVMITGGVRDARLLEDLAIEVRKRGAHPLIQLESERNLTRSFTEVPSRYDSQAPEWLLKLGTLVDAMFSVEFTEAEDHHADLPPERLAAVQKAGEVASRLMLQRNVQLVHLGNGLYPTATRARLFGISQDELTRLFWAGVNVDYQKLQSTGEAVKQRLTTGKEVEITAPNGTHLRMRIEGRPVTVSDGVISPEDRKRGGSSLMVWLPAGEVYLVPVPGTAEGKVVVDRHVHQGKEIVGLTVSVKDGRLTGMTARSGLERLQKEYEVAGPGKEQLSVLDFGINPNVPLTPGSRLTAYVPAGMVTVGFGNDAWAGGENHVPFGFGLFLAGTTVKVDGRVLVEKGVLRP